MTVFYLSRTSPRRFFTMGIGRREFLKLFGAALASVALPASPAVVLLDDYYTGLWQISSKESASVERDFSRRVESS
jgi:hypothetical protein